MLKDFLVDLGYSKYDCGLFLDLRKECFNNDMDSILNISPLFKLLEEDSVITREDLDNLKNNPMFVNKNSSTISIKYSGIHYIYAYSTVIACDLYENKISKEMFVDLINSLNECSIEEYEKKLSLYSNHTEKSNNLLKVLK